MAEEPTLSDKLVALLGERDAEDTVKTVMHSIRKLEFKAAEGAVAQFLNSENPVIRKHAVMTIGVLKSIQYNDAIIRLLDDRFTFVQKEAINTLRELKIASSVVELENYRLRTQDNGEECDLALAMLGNAPALDRIEKSVREQLFSTEYIQEYWDILFDSKGQNCFELMPFLFGEKITSRNLRKIVNLMKEKIEPESWHTCLVEIKKYSGRGDFFDRFVNHAFPRL